VEDPALRDVALGGPDTGQRSRLIQHIVRLGTNATTCEGAIKESETQWRAKGLFWDSTTARLLASAALKVNFLTQGVTPDPCDPQATGGYLKPDNQLIRIKVTSFDTTAGKGTFVWGFDDASFLYRVEVKDSQTLKLGSVPIDEFHQPKAPQVVEILRTATQLTTGGDLGVAWQGGPFELSPDAFIASAAGIVTALSKDYDQVTQQVGLSVALPAGFPPQPTPVTFMRVWEEQVSFTLGQKTSLGNSGMQVTLSTLNPLVPIAVGSYWMVAVRPSTPTSAYPQRYLDQPQPPDGPRLWACPLALVNWEVFEGGKTGVMTRLEDCRNLFDNLVELTKRAPATPQTWNRVSAIAPWTNDWPLALNQFNGGLSVTTASAADATTLSENTCQVVLDLMAELPGFGGLFRVPVEVRGLLQEAGNTFTFVPKPSIAAAQLQAWINVQTEVEKKLGLPLTPGIRCRIILKGNTILDDQGNPLDGNVFGVIKQKNGHAHTDLQLPYSGDGTEGGDFESWFFLAVPPRATLIKPQPGEVFVAPNNLDAVEVRFSRPMDLSTIDGAAFTVASSETGALVTGKVSASSTATDSTAIFTPSAPFPIPSGGTITYTIRLDGTKVMDTYGMLLDGANNGTAGTDFTSSFTINRLTRVAAFVPAGGTHFAGSSPPANAVVTFTWDVRLGTISTTGLKANFIVKNDNFDIVVYGVLTADPNSPPNQGVVFTPPHGFPANNTTEDIDYSITVDGSSILDEAGNLLDAGDTGKPGSSTTSTFTINKKTTGKEPSDKAPADKDVRDHPNGEHAPRRPSHARAGQAVGNLPSGSSRESGGDHFIRPEERPEVGRQALVDGPR
jgi:hypothetical protein